MVVDGVSGVVIGNSCEIDVGGLGAGRVGGQLGGRGTCDKLITEVVRSDAWVLGVWRLLLKRSLGSGEDVEWDRVIIWVKKDGGYEAFQPVT